jgi:hypothetical protein
MNIISITYVSTINYLDSIELFIPANTTVLIWLLSTYLSPGYPYF